MRVKAAEAGDRIFKVLGEHLGGLNRGMLQVHTDLKEHQVARGLAWLDDLAEDEDYDFYVRVHEGGEWIYRLGEENPRDAREHYFRQVRTRVTQAKRALKRTQKMHRRRPTWENELQVEMAERVLQDVQLIKRVLAKEEAA